MSDTGREASDSPQQQSAAAEPSASPEESPPHDKQQQRQQQQPDHPPFEPLFTLLTNASTNTTIHPRVHYLFCDDDPSILSSSDPSDRGLIVDLAADTTAPSGWAVSWASSLSADFAVTEAQLSAQQGQSQGEGAILRVDGVERDPIDARKSENAAGSVADEDMDELVEDFRRRMEVLRRVVGEGEKRREVLNREQEQEEEQQHEVQGTAGDIGATGDGG